MSHRKAKKIRKAMRERGLSPKEYRKLYQELKRVKVTPH